MIHFFVQWLWIDTKVRLNMHQFIMNNYIPWISHESIGIALIYLHDLSYLLYPCFSWLLSVLFKSKHTCSSSMGLLTFFINQNDRHHCRYKKNYPSYGANNYTNVVIWSICDNVWNKCWKSKADFYIINILDKDMYFLNCPLDVFARIRLLKTKSTHTYNMSLKNKFKNVIKTIIW